MATTPYFHWPPHSSSDAVAGFTSGAPELMATPATTAVDTGVAVVSPERAVPTRTRVRRNSSGSGKHQAGGGGAKKPPQRGLGVAELERLRCGGDPLREFAGAEGDVSAQVHPLMHCDHSVPLLAPPPAPPRPAGPGCYVHHPASPEQQYFVERWGRAGPGFGPTGNAGGGEHHQAQQPPPPEHPSSQNSIWRPAASSSRIQSGHRCDLCARRMMRAYAERGAPPPAAPTSLTAVPHYSIYDLAAAMATAHHQGETAAFQVRDRKRGALPGEELAKKEVREIEFFPRAESTHNTGGGIGTGPDESELVAPAVSSYGAGSFAARPPLDLSLRL